MSTKNDISTGIGLTIYKGNWEGAEWTLSGYPDKKVIGYEYQSAYDFEDAVKRNINCSGITFDCESCQFFAYAKTKTRLVSFANKIKKHYEEAKNKY